MSNSLWHSVSEEEKEAIKKEAKLLLQKFSSKLTNSKGVEEHFVSSVSQTGIRETFTPWNTDAEFRSHFFSNAPLVENDCIVAEKGEWKKSL